MAYNSKQLTASSLPRYPYTLHVEFGESNANPATNQSTISIAGYISSSGGSWSSGYASVLKIYWYDNNTGKETHIASSGGFTSLAKNGKQSISASINVNHRGDGSLSGYAKVEFVAGSTSGGYCPASNNVATATTTLATIPRASGISNLKATNLGSAVSLTIDRKVASFTHKVEYSFSGSAYIVASTNATTSASFTPALTLASNIPNSATGALTVRVTTLNGATVIGSTTDSINLGLPATVIPTIGTPTATRVDNGIPTAWGIYVKGFSKTTIKIPSASGIYGSTIKSYSISGYGLNIDASTGTSSILNTVGVQKYTCTVMDSRGRTATKTVSITVIDYSPPSLSVTAERCNTQSVVNPNGTSLLVKVDFVFSSVSSKNSIKAKSVTCNGVTNTTFGDNVAFNLPANCSIGSKYTLTASVTDGLGKIAKATVQIQTSKRLMNVDKNKTGVAFGGFYDPAIGGAVQVDGILAVRYIKVDGRVIDLTKLLLKD